MDLPCNWKWVQQATIKLFLLLGTRMFNFIQTYCDEQGRTRAIHFAMSQRDFNISVRTQVELLDENNHEQRTTSNETNVPDQGVRGARREEGAA